MPKASSLKERCLWVRQRLVSVIDTINAHNVEQPLVFEDQPYSFDCILLQMPLYFTQITKLKRRGQEMEFLGRVLGIWPRRNGKLVLGFKSLKDGRLWADCLSFSEFRTRWHMTLYAED